MGQQFNGRITHWFKTLIFLPLCLCAWAISEHAHAQAVLPQPEMGNYPLYCSAGWHCFYVPNKTPAPPPCIACERVGNPIDLASGLKQQDVVDYSSADHNLEVRRSYALQTFDIPRNTEFGYTWAGVVPASGWIDMTGPLVLNFIFPHYGRLEIAYDPVAQTWSYLNRDYPNRIRVTVSSTASVPSASTAWPAYFASTAVTWTVTLGNGEIYTIKSLTGSITGTERPVVVATKQLPNGYLLTYSYQTAPNQWPGALVSNVAGSDGRTLKVSWTTNNSDSGGNVFDANVSRIDLPDGSYLQYQYVTMAMSGTMHLPANALQEVDRFPAAGGSPIWKQSYVPDTHFAIYELGGIVDALGVQRSVYSYFGAGQLGSTGRSDGSETYSVAYSTFTNGSTSLQRDVTNPAGKISHYYFATDTQNYSPPTGIIYTGVTEDASSQTPARTLSRVLSGQDIQSETNFNGTTTAYQYDAQHRPTIVTYAVGTALQRQEATTWHPTLDLPVQEVLPNKTVGYNYDSIGRLLRRTETDTTSQSVPYSTARQTRTWGYTWTALGKVQTVTGPRPAVSGKTDLTTYAYDTANNLISVTNPLGQITKFGNYDANGRPGTMTDITGLVTILQYDPIGRLQTRTVQGGSGGNAVTSFSYDLEGQLISVKLPSTDMLTIAYTQVGRVDHVSDSAGNTVQYGYDAFGNRNSETTTRGSGGVRKTITKVFDDLSRLTSVTLGPNRTVQYQYDLNDNPTKVIDARSNATQIAFDALDRVGGTLTPVGGSTVDSYDGQDNQTGHRDAIGVQTTYVRNGFGDVIQEVSPDRGTTTYVYNSGGDLIQSTDGRGQVLKYGRDLLGRLTSKTPVGVTNQNIGYAWDTVQAGRLSSVKDTNNQTYFYYDARGNVIKRVSKTGTVSTTVSFTYDTADRILSITYPSGRIVTYMRDARGRVQAVNLQAKAGAASVGLAANLTYDAFGPLTSIALGNGLALTQNFGSDDRLYTRTLAGAGGSLWSKTYGYDNDDNITSITDNVIPAKSLTQLIYDGNSRLTQAIGSVSLNIGREDYGYDANGNRTTLNRFANATDASPAVSAGHTLVPGSNRLDHVTDAGGTRQFTYNGMGSPSQETRAAVDTTLATTSASVYDAYGRLTSATYKANSQQTMLYNGLDQRVQLATTSLLPRTFVYDLSGRLMGEYGSSATAVLAEHVWLDPDASEQDGWQPLAILGAGTAVNWVTGDHLGTPAVITAANGSVVNRYDAEPFGRRWASLAALPDTALAQPGQYVDGAIGDVPARYYNMYRDYDPTVGRYLEADPIGLDGGENAYGYASNNALGLYDSTGRQVAIPNPAIAAAIVAAVLGTEAAEKISTKSGSNDWNAKNYETYTRYNPTTGQCYSGRTSGYGSPLLNVAVRGRQQLLLNLEGFNQPVLDRFSNDSSSIRGREQQLIDINGGARISGGTSRNLINGISKYNPFYDAYLTDATAEFGRPYRSSRCSCH